MRKPSLLPPGRHWWEELDDDFARSSEGFALGSRERFQVRMTAFTDVLLRTGAATAMGALAFPLGYNPWELEQAMADRAFYGPIAESGDRTRFFLEPPKGVRIRSKPGDWFPRFDPEDGYCETLTFDSPFMPVNPAQQKKYLRHTANRVAHARYWRHADGPRPTIIACHGFSADMYLVNEWFFALPWFYRLGCDVMLFTLPFHGTRQTRFSPFSGHGYFAGGPSRINEAVAHSVFDLRIIVDWLMEVRGVEKIGVTGVSLGGFTSSMLACAEPRLTFAIPNVPVVSLADLVLEWQPVGAMIRAALHRHGLDLAAARYMVAASCPLSYPPAIPTERLMIVGGVGDRLAPPKHSRLLWDHWGRCRIHWFPGSHILHMDRGEYMRQVARFLRRVDVLTD